MLRRPRLTNVTLRWFYVGRFLPAEGIQGCGLCAHRGATAGGSGGPNANLAREICPREPGNLLYKKPKPRFRPQRDAYIELIGN